MKKSDLYIRITTAVLFVAVVVYIVVSIYNTTMNTYETVPAIKYTVERTYTTRGYIVRTESILPDSGPAVFPVVGEGEKVASGQAIAVEYMTGEALEAAGEIRELRLLIGQLENSGGDNAVEAARLETVMDLSSAVQRGDLNGLDELIMDIETNIFSGGSVSISDLPALKAQLEALEASASGVRMIYAPVSGTFSQTTDGFEHIGPDALSDIIPAELAELFHTPARVSGAYKLVTEFKWYYAAIMDAADAAHLAEGRTIALQFSGAYYASAEMLVEYISKRDGDECAVIFSSDRSIHELVSFRELRADIVFDVIVGIRVPKEAIRLDDDASTFIYLQTGARAERVDVEILTETGDSYLVRDGAEAGTPLRAGSTIIVKANDLYDGKVVG